jgi:hypothetical protein
VTHPPNVFPEARLEFRCAELTQTPITHLDLSGTLVLRDVDDRFTGLLDLHSGESLAWPIAENQRIGSLAVAPNRLQYAYQLVDESSGHTQLVIARAGAEDVTRVAWHETWRSIIAWLGDDALSISARHDFVHAIMLDAVVVVDWPSLRQRTFPPDYPDMWDVTPRPDWGPFTLSEVVYDPSLQLAVYPAYPLDRSEPDGAVVLWDIAASRPIQRIVGRVLYGQAPVWSPDAQQLLVNNSLTLNLPPDAFMGLDQELFSVSRIGEVTRLTFLTEFSRQVSFGKSSWSPDGRYVAGWLESRGEPYPAPYDFPDIQPVERLFVLEVATGEVVNYCIPGDLYSAYSEPPIWSPDGTRVGFVWRRGRATGDTYVLDPVTGQATLLVAEKALWGWLASAP